MNYEWTRFWVPRTGSVNLADGGFMVDPTDALLWGYGEPPIALAELEDHAALVLLGEPGIGKSDTIEKESTRLRTVGDGTLSIHANLRSFSSESFLFERVFESKEMQTWKDGQAHLTLYLDSLDEALLRIDTIANLIAEELPKLPTDRLSVRIACRTAAWPELTLEPVLRTIWGDNQVGVFELAPLCRRDVMAAARQERVDPTAFMTELYAANAVPFAIKPLTLKLLLTLFARDQKLPRELTELYTQGCLRLCEEQNPSRRDTRRTGSLSPQQRFRIASKLAYVCMFANRYAVWIGPETDEIPAEDVLLSKNAGGSEHGTFPPFEVTEGAVRETLDTGLFNARGPSRIGWAHQSYAEFLAASYLNETGISTANILRLLVHPAGGLVPQLAVVAAWAASLNPGVRTELIATEPVTLLQGDLNTWTDTDKAALTRSLLHVYADQRGHDFVLGRRRGYAKLAHPGLADQIRPYLKDRTRNAVVRRAAIEIAEACKVDGVAQELMDVAFDPADDGAIRSRAIAAIGACAGNSLFPKLLPFAQEQIAPDSNCEIKGEALRILWPNHITASDLFALITRPNDSFFGAYANFLTHILPETLTVNDLVPALEWATKFLKASGHIGDFHRKRLADAILAFGWEHLETPTVTVPFVGHVLSRLEQGGALFRGADFKARDKFLANLKSDAMRRRAFLRTALTRKIEPAGAWPLRNNGLCQREDLQSLLDSAPGGAAPVPALDPGTLCIFIEQIFKVEEADQFEAIYAACGCWPLLRTRFSWLLDGIDYRSPEAKRLRETHEAAKAFENRRPDLLTPPPAERVRRLLEAYVFGDVTAWWRLNRELTLTIESQHYGADHDYVITRMPGWVGADDDTRAAIASVAECFLSDAESMADQAIATDQYFYSDYAAFRALILLKQVRPEVYTRLPAEIWRKWAPVAAIVPYDTSNDETALVQDMIGECSSHAAAEFADTVARIIQHERLAFAQKSPEDQDKAGEPFHVLRLIGNCWGSDHLKQMLLAELSDPQNTLKQFSAILGPLIDAGYEPARDQALALLSDQDPKRRDYVLIAASKLLGAYARLAWSVIWGLVQGDDEFGKQLFLDQAYNHRLQVDFYVALTEAEQGDLYVWMEETFPRAQDAKLNGRFVGARDMVGDLRDGILRHLVGLGTPAAVREIRKAIGRLPLLDWLPYQLIEAEQLMRVRTWSPLSVDELVELTRYRAGTLVQTPEDLRQLLVEVLRQYEKELHGEQTPVRLLWDRQQGGETWRPVEEDALSDSVKLFLQRTLNAKGVVLNREVEIGRAAAAPVGTRTDIRVDAFRKSDDGTRYDLITAVIETKGCWNPELFTALEGQLYRNYLVRLGAPVGIYLVGWFDKAHWDDKDSRKKKVPALTSGELQDQLSTKAGTLPVGVFVEAVVLDCHLHAKALRTTGNAP